ncbi:MAG: hypothetical protein IT374_16320 [Polyangiaceae bacterium]|nr:hypothetical protein [Polyangiaceae bacterium]
MARARPLAETERAAGLSIARVLLPEGRETTALAARGRLYRVDVLDRTLGTALGKHTPGLDRFSRRVLSLGPSTLFDHWAELEGGARCDDATLEEPLYLPVARADAVVLEIDATLRRFTRVEGSLRGSGAARPRVRGGTLSFTPAVAIVLGEEVFAPRQDEAADAIVGVTLGLLWGVDGTRDFGAHLGPWLRSPAPSEVTLTLEGEQHHASLEPSALGALVARAARIVPRVPGDVLLLPVAPARPVSGAPVRLRAAGMGELVAT